MINVVIQVSNHKESIKNRSFQIINGVPEIVYLIRRLKRDSELIPVIATSSRHEDDVYEMVAESENIGICRGDFDNVMDRLYRTAVQIKAENLVRVTAKSPLVDINALKELYKAHTEGNYDYSYNEHNKGVVWGIGCDVFRMSFLKELNNMELKKEQKESIDFFIRQSIVDHRILKKTILRKRPGYKLFYETSKDLEVICELVNNLGEEINNDSIIDYLSNHKLVAEYNREIPPKEVGLDKLFLHPDKIKSLLDSTDLDNSYPISIEMTLTNQCNLKCSYCSDADLRERQGFGEQIELDVIKRLFIEFARGGVKGITLEGGGEPTLYKNFYDVVKIAKEEGLALGLITNGTRQLDEEIVKEFEWIRVSLDASTSEEYLNLKGADFFERVISNIRYFSQYCGTVGIGYVVTNSNISEIESLVMRVRELGVSYIQLRPVVDNEDLYPRDVDLSYLKAYQSRSFAVIIDGMKENAEAGNYNLPCKAHSLTSILSGDGSVYICGRLNTYDWLKPIGNINETSFYDIWNGDERKAQARQIMDADFCAKKCPQCRISKFNNLLYRLEETNSKHFI